MGGSIQHPDIITRLLSCTHQPHLHMTWIMKGELALQVLVEFGQLFLSQGAYKSTCTKGGPNVPQEVLLQNEGLSGVVTQPASAK